MLSSVEVFDWMGLKHVKLEGLSPKLNLVLGVNESGKSRLMTAIHFGLFEGHKGSAQYKKDLQSFGGNETPKVVIEFLHDGVHYKIEKHFISDVNNMFSNLICFNCNFKFIFR